MKVVGLNLLLYAVNRDSHHHAPAKELCSTDGDFARFRQLRWMNPLAAQQGAS